MNTSASVVDLTQDSWAEVLEVLHQAFGAITAEFGITAANTPSNPAFWTEADVAHAVGRPLQLFGLEADGHLVGCAFVGATAPASTVWTLRHLAVRPGAGGRGCGRRLVAEAADRARTGGATVLRIGIVAENLRLSCWYIDLGFVAVEQGRRYPGLPFSVDYLELAL